MYIRFQTKTVQKKNILWGSTYCTTGLCKGEPPFPPPPLEFVPRSVPIVFLLTVNRICLAVTLLFVPISVSIFLFRGKIQLLEHRENSPWVIAIWSSLLWPLYKILRLETEMWFLSLMSKARPANENKSIFVSLNFTPWVDQMSHAAHVKSVHLRKHP